MQNLHNSMESPGGSSSRLTAGDLQKIAALVYQKSGIALRDGKGALVIARLQKRLRHGGFTSFAAYLAFLERDRSGVELTAVLDAIATNHTSFFREIDHFHFLASDVLRGLLAKSATRPIIGWSAACSTGEEAYSIFVTLLEHTPTAHQTRLRLLASDLSTHAIRAARSGVYALDRVTELSR